MLDEMTITRGEGDLRRRGKARSVRSIAPKTLTSKMESQEGRVVEVQRLPGAPKMPALLMRASRRPWSWVILSRAEEILSEEVRSSWRVAMVVLGLVLVWRREVTAAWPRE